MHISPPVFGEKLSSHLVNLLKELELTFGKDSSPYKSIQKQFIKSEEEETTNLTNDRHYHAGGNLLPRNYERLYDQSAVIELTFACSSHCRYCLRSHYRDASLSRQDVLDIIEWINKDEKPPKEVLITGGDPLLSPVKLTELIEKLSLIGVEKFRIATRLFTHDPKSIPMETLYFLKGNFNIEIATQINHWAELTIETKFAIQKVINKGIPIYAQNVMLRGVNNNIEDLTVLYKELRTLGVEAHYLFHCVPMAGTDHFRTDVRDDLELIQKLNNSGVISGRAKPTYAFMTEIGKIIPYPGNLSFSADGKNIFLKSKYKLSERQLNNPSWKLPSRAYIGKDEYLGIQYKNGET